MKGDRNVGGLWCHEVLERLSDYLDDELAADERDQIDAHLRGCDTCERFGGEFASAVKAIRQGLATPPSLDPSTASALETRVFKTE